MGRIKQHYGQAHHAYVGHKKSLAESVEHKEYSQAYRTFLVVYALILAFLTSGVIFGWPAVLMVLHREGVYDNNCPGHWHGNSTFIDSSSSSSSYLFRDGPLCHDQVERLSLVFVISVTAYLCTFFFTNIFLRRFGPRLTCGIGAVAFLVGSLLFAFSSYHNQHRSDFDGFIPGYILMAIGGPFIVSSFVHLSNLFPHSKGLIITCFNIAVDASAICFVLFEILNDYYGCSRRLFFIIYSIIPIVILLTIWVWPRSPFTASVLLEDTEPYSEGTDDSEDDDGESVDPRKRNKALDRADLHSHTPTHAYGKLHVHDRDMAVRDRYAGHRTRDQIATTCFLFLLIFGAIHLFRLHYYIATVFYQLFTIDAEHAEVYTRLFTIIVPIVAILSVPLVRILLDHCGIVITLLVLLIFGLGANAFWMLDNGPLWIQVFGFILLGFFRALLLSSLSHYLALWFGFKHFGKLWGMIMLISGIVNLLVYFVIRIVNDLWDADWFWMNLIMLLVGLATAFFVLWVEIKIRRRNAVTLRDT